ncbi:MAG TPA: Holliday junction branch migration protein RuvA [Parachlamydiaceae bacterium]|nr:Holliday junction branch migration protein RuvA [Parachlamydiaceae bacterium]
MYAYIKGILTESCPIYAVLEAFGIGYKIYIPVDLFAKLPALKEELLLYTSFVIRENAQTLYGFLSPKERDLFETLQGVTGIGPKLALCIIGHLEVKSLHAAISHQDIAAISKVPGVGKKTAERLIIEFRDKLDTLFPESSFNDYAIDLQKDPKKVKIHDAMSALINLGYSQMVAEKAIKKVLEAEDEESLDLGSLITAALRRVQ